MPRFHWPVGGILRLVEFAFALDFLIVHDERRKIIREWMSFPKDKRQTEEQVKTFAKKDDSGVDVMMRISNTIASRTAAEREEYHRN